MTLDKKPPKRTSSVLSDALDRLEMSRDRPKPSNPVIRAVQNDVLGATERLLTKTQASIAGSVLSNRTAAEWLLDDVLSRHFVKQVPHMVKRSVRFDAIAVERDVPTLVSGYLREASQAYVVGLNAASVALCRSALEEALKDRLPRVLVSSGTLAHLLKAAEASRTLKWATHRVATDVQKLAGRVLHGSTCTSEDAYDTLVKVRHVLESLYAA